MDQINATIAPEDAAPDLAAAVRQQRDRARKFLADWHSSGRNLEQQLLSQLEATAREVAAAAGGELDEGDLQRRQSELADERMRLERLREELSQRETEQRDRFAQLAAEHQGLMSQLSQQVQQLDERRAALAENEKAAAGQLQRLQDVQALLDERTASIAALVQEFQKCERQARQAQGELDLKRGEISQSQQQLAQQQAELEQAADSLAERARHLDQRQRELDERAAQSEQSRKQLARELKVRRAEQLLEIETRRAELEQIAASEDAEIERQLARLQDELVRLNEQTQHRGEQADDLRRQLEAARTQIEKRDGQIRELTERLEQIAAADHHSAGEAAALVAQLAEIQERADSQHAASQAALAQARAEQQQLKTELLGAQAQTENAQRRASELEELARSLEAKIHKAGDGEAQKRIKELQRERDALVERLREAEQVSHNTGGAEAEELRRRLETAMEDIRRLKSENAALSANGAAASRTGEAVVGLDWESQKRRMLAQLESESDEDDPQSAEDRLTVEGAINITDQVVAEKDREIEELKRLLEDQSKNIEGVAVGAAAIASMLDSDELLRQEREKLEALQQEWREKLRKAEIDISVERAKIARDRAELEDKLQVLKQARISDAAEDDGGENGKRPKRSRWLARLGLGEEDQQ